MTTREIVYQKGWYMGKIQVQRNIGGIEGLHIIEPKVFQDNRGYLMESYNDTDFQEEGLTYKFIQDNEAYSKKKCSSWFSCQSKSSPSKIDKSCHWRNI